MANFEIREAAMKANIRLWQIAAELGVADCNFSRKLRRELPAEEKERIITIINELSKEAN